MCRACRLARVVTLSVACVGKCHYSTCVYTNAARAWVNQKSPNSVHQLRVHFCVPNLMLLLDIHSSVRGDAVDGRSCCAQDAVLQSDV